RGNIPARDGAQSRGQRNPLCLGIRYGRSGATVSDQPWRPGSRRVRTQARVEYHLLAQLMRERGLKSAIVVTDPFHSRRALHTIERAASDLTFYSSPVPPGPTVWRPERWWARRGDMYLTVREGIAWANTLLGGLRWSGCPG